MLQRPFGKTDMQVSAVGFGGAEIGYESASPGTVERLIGIALDMGVNVIDTAECYDSSEELIGNAVSHRRSEYFLFSKCGHASGFSEPDWDTGMLEKQIDRSLSRLKTDHLDLLQLHTCSKDLLVQGDVINVLQRAKSAGKTRYIGYSGDHDDALYAVQCGAFDSLQTSVSIADQEAIHLTIPVAGANGMAVIAKRSIANAAWKTKTRPDHWYAQEYYDRLQKLDYPFLSGDLQQAVSTALRFTLSIPGVSVCLIGTAAPDRLKLNLESLSGDSLAAEQFSAITNRWNEVAPPEWCGQR